MTLFQTALTTAVDLAESCDPQDQQDASSTTMDLQDEEEEDPHSAVLSRRTMMEDLCRFAAVPVATGHDNDGASPFYFFQQVVYLNPAAAAAATLEQHDDDIRSLSRLYLVVLLWNASLACYQLGHACLLQPPRPQQQQGSSHTTNHHPYAIKAQALFRKSLELYAQLTGLTASDFMARIPEAAVTSLLRFLSLAAANNYTLVCLQQGHDQQAQQAQQRLVGLLSQQQQRTGSFLPSSCVVLQGVLREFLLNTTVMTVTGFHRYLSAGAA